MSRKCGECGKYFKLSELTKIGVKEYCIECKPSAQARKEFQDYVCWLFGLKSPGPLIWSQRKTFIEKYGYTDRQMISILKFIYEIKKTPRNIASLGLITSNLEAAKEYYQGLKKDGDNLTKDLQNLVNNPNPVREINLSQAQTAKGRGGKKSIDLNTLFEE